MCPDSTTPRSAVLNCPVCGKTFRRQNWQMHLRSGRPNCCSHRCAIAYRRSLVTLDGKFWKHVEKTDGCWEWRGFKGGNGYGRLTHKGVTYGAHRLSWTLHHGPIPEGMCVCHTCDNRGCVNPNHLFLGTTQDNTKDMEQKGRKAIGERSGRSLVTEHAVREIRAVYAAGGITMKELGARFGCTRHAIFRIVHRMNWKQVE